MVDTKTNSTKGPDLREAQDTHQRSLEKTREGQPFYMPRKLTKAQGKELLEKTKRRQRLLQEARTSARPEEVDIEISEKLGRQFHLEHLELSGELDLPDNSTTRQYT